MKTNICLHSSEFDFVWYCAEQRLNILPSAAIANLDDWADMMECGNKLEQRVFL